MRRFGESSPEDTIRVPEGNLGHFLLLGFLFSRKKAGAWSSTVPDPAPGRSLRLRKWEESESDQTVWPRHHSWWKVTFHMNLCLLERAESKAEDEVADVQRRPLEASDYRGVKLTYSLWLRGGGLPIHTKQQKQETRQTNKSFTVELLGQEAPSHSHLDIFKMCSSFGVGPVYGSFFPPLTHPKGTSASALGNRKSPNITAKMVKLCNPVLDKMQPNEREDQAILVVFKQLSLSFPLKRKHTSRHERLSRWTWQKSRALSFLTFEFSLTSSQSMHTTVYSPLKLSHTDSFWTQTSSRQ